MDIDRDDPYSERSLYIDIYLLRGISFRFINTNLSKKYSLRTGSQLARASVRRERRVAGIFLRVVLYDSCLMPPQLRITRFSTSIILNLLSNCNNIILLHKKTEYKQNILNNRDKLKLWFLQCLLPTCLLLMIEQNLKRDQFLLLTRS